MLLEDIYKMKHLKLYEEFEEKKLPPGVEEIYYDDYHAKDGMLRSIKNVSLSKEEKEMLEMLCEWGKLQINNHEGDGLEAARRTPRKGGYWAPPGATFGKKESGIYYLVAFFPDFTHKYYISKSLEDLLPIAIDVIQPKMPGWIEIR